MTNMQPGIIRFATCLILALFFTGTPAYAQDDGLGQTIQIYTYLKSYIGRPSWLLIIRDIDHGQNLPYIYDFNQENNFWMAFTYGKNYLITTSELQFAPYRRNPDSRRVVKDFCGLESNGRIIRGQSLFITITGKLTPYRNTYRCNVLKYANMRFNMPH